MLRATNVVMVDILRRTGHATRIAVRACGTFAADVVARVLLVAFNDDAARGYRAALDEVE